LRAGRSRAVHRSDAQLNFDDDRADRCFLGHRLHPSISGSISGSIGGSISGSISISISISISVRQNRRAAREQTFRL
jgi:hypothetical protein